MGEVFREWYGKVSQLRSLAPTNTPVLALTATSTLNVRTKIIQHLGMGSCAVVQGSLDRPNIRYSAVKVSRDLELAFGWLLQEIETKRTSLPRTVIFCRSIKTCASLFKLFLSHLREKSYEPVGSELSVANRLFAMYHARIDDSDKREILASLTDPDGKCRLLFCTVAFGMGVNIPDIRYIIHYGPPTDIDDYFQECGRAGRDGSESFAILYLFGGCTIGRVSPKMKEYCKLSKGCRRNYLLYQFSSEVAVMDNSTVEHYCCDLCTINCVCLTPYTPCPAELCECTEQCHASQEQEERAITTSQRLILTEKLREFKQSIVLINNTDCVPLYVGNDLACGLPDYVIDLIVANCQFIYSIQDLEDKCLIWNYGNQIMDIIDEVVS
jgi:ATP-dependent DNA helicase RecQ